MYRRYIPRRYKFMCCNNKICEYNVIICCGYVIFALVKILQLFKDVYCYLLVILHNRCTLLDCGCTVHSCLCTHRVPKVATVATTGVHCGIVGNKKKILKKRRSIFFFIILECICVPSCADFYYLRFSFELFKPSNRCFNLLARRSALLVIIL